MLTVKITDQSVLQALQSMQKKAANLGPAMREIGEDLTTSTKARFSTATAPDGTPWAANSATTMAMYLGLFKGSYKKDGTLSKKGEKRSAGKKPLTGESKSLGTTINYQVITGPNVSAVRIGSPMVYAAMQQFGGESKGFIKSTIPARPFLGLSDDDSTTVLDVLTTYLQP
jgi:phage gpG-like protein